MRRVGKREFLNAATSPEVSLSISVCAAGFALSCTLLLLAGGPSVGAPP